MTPETNPHTPLLFGPKTKGGHDIDFIAGNGTHLTCIYPRCVIVGGIGYKLSAGGECFELDMWGDAFYDEETAQFDLVPCTMNDELAPQLYTMWEKDAEIARLREANYSVREQIERQLAAGKNPNPTAELVGKWLGDETLEELLAMLNK